MGADGRAPAGSGGGNARGGDAAGGGTRRRLLRWGLLALAALAAAAGAWAWHLHGEVETKWRAHAPRVPSRVYGAPTALYPGLRMSRAGLVARLDARGYRRTDHPSPEPGHYRLPGPGRAVVHLRDAVLAPPRGRRSGRRLVLRFSERVLTGMSDRATGEPVLDAELEPPRIAVLLGDRMVRRAPVTLGRIPAELVEAVLAVEDRRFWDHAGVDPVRIAGAAWHDLRAGRLAQGASTLTQQLVRSYWLDRDRTFRRKAREATMAVLLEAEHEKPEILEAYLNEVYLGQDGPVSLAGVGAAARHWFGQEVSELDLAECALLAGMIRAPNRYDPFRRPDAARRRRDLVLRLMEEQGRIDAGRGARAREAELPTPPARRPVNAAPWYVDHVQQELEERYSREELRREGLRIWTALRPEVQAAARRAVRQGLEALEASHPGLRRASDASGAAGRGDAADDSAPGVVRPADPAADTAGARRLQAALAAVDPRTGDLVALVGGRDWGRTQFNRAIRARRQPGSLFKPFVLLAALADTTGRWTLASTVSDTAFTVVSGGESWSPRNYGGEEHGTVTLREAVVHSYNIAVARLGMEVGLAEVASTARALGLPGPFRPVPSLSLGAFEATPLEMAGAYATLAGGGLRPEVAAVRAAAGPDGEPLADRPTSVRRVAPAGPVHLVNRTLQAVLEEGTASAAATLGYRGPAAGKTGTSSGYRDAWFVGYTPDLVAVVWVGFDDGRSLGVDGAGAALPIWARFVTALEDRPDDFLAPEGVVRAEVRGPDGGCAEALFLEGTVPEDRRCGGGPWPF